MERQIEKGRLYIPNLVKRQYSKETEIVTKFKVVKLALNTVRDLI